MSVSGLFVAGTDTGVGKTEVACALLAALGARGLDAVGMKPVASGCVRTPSGLRNADVERLRAASGVRAARRLVNPYAFAPPVAPHIAAAEAGVEIEYARILASYRALAARADAVVVEGVGGFAVPLGRRADMATLAARLALPVVLVVGMRLGCLNHALLTVEAIGRRRLALAGWVANRVDASMRRFDANVDALSERLGCAPLAVVPWCRSRARLRAHLAGAALARVIDR